MIDIRLRVFLSAAMNLSFTKASQELFISQPAISKHIQELEREYNCRLFDRLGNHIQLTHAGLLLLEHTKKIQQDYQQMDYDMNSLQEKVAGELRVGASTTISQYVLPGIIADFHKRFPDIRITILSGNSREVETALREGRIDLGMVEGFVRQPELKYHPFMDDELVPIVRTSSRLAKYDTITLEQLRAVPLVLREFGSGSLDVLQKALETQHIALTDLNIEMNLGTTEGIKHYVERTDAMGIVSIQAVRDQIYADIFKIVDIEHLKFERKFCFVEKQGASPKLQSKFKHFITSSYKA